MLRHRFLLVGLLCAAVLVSSGSAVAARHPLATAVLPAEALGPLASQRIHSAGATFVSLTASWASIAPTRPARPRDPADPAYHWESLDTTIAEVSRAGLKPIVTLLQAPGWAQTQPDVTPFNIGRVRPDPLELADFARAAAERYGGLFAGLPRVRYWAVWNEPNISLFFVPQFEGQSPFSPGWYRKMVNDVAAEVHGVHSDNAVLAGQTAPFFDNTPPVQAVDRDWGPLSFMRELLCLSPSLTPTCNDPVHFDIWSHHPYASGGPAHHAVLPNDVSVADLPKMRAVLNAALRAGHVISSRKVAFWVTEFSWDSNPPDPNGVPVLLEARWASEALYRMWLDGVDLVTWFGLRDLPYPESIFQPGLYFRGATIESDRPKPVLQSFRFPFVAYRHGAHVAVWGRTPGGKRARVVVEVLRRGRWLRRGIAATDAYGILDRRYPLPAGASLVRARVYPHGAASLPFSLTPVPDRFYNPFGLGTPLEPQP